MFEDIESLIPVRWVGSSLQDLRGFPEPVREVIGYALFRAQQGGTARGIKPLKGIVRGGSVLQISERYGGDTYRAVYALGLPGAIYVLHAFKKKSSSGARTRQQDLDLIRLRLAAARADALGGSG